MPELTIAIVAHNAEETIARAVSSAKGAGDFPILLIADGCNDDTANKAKQAGGDQITIFSIADNAGVGAARQYALEHIQTPFGMWLDADDEILPERPHYMLKALQGGADLVFDGGLLVDSSNGEIMSKLSIPDFMFSNNAELRCFERNYFPILAGGFSSNFAQKVGFDPSFTCAEDYDFLLRAIFQKAKIQPLKQHAYKYFHRASTISRNLEKTRNAVAAALLKHSFGAIEKLLASSVVHPDEQACILAGSALYQNNADTAILYASKPMTEKHIVPTYNLSPKLLAAFFQATAHAKNGNWLKAHTLLETYIEKSTTAEAWNNMGVAYYHLGQKENAKMAFEKALDQAPDYQDAARNSVAEPPIYWTTHPLRRQKNRTLYS